MTQTAEKNATTMPPPFLYVAFELSGSSWKLVFSDGRCERLREWMVKAGDQGAVLDCIQRAKAKFVLPATTAVRSVYEAGRDGFWIHRWLETARIENLIIDPASLPVDRRAKHRKTDRLDAQKMVRWLVRWHRGEKDAFRVVQVPTPEHEDQRRATRERQRLLEEEKGHRARIQGLLALHGIVEAKVEALDLQKARCANGHPLPPRIKEEIEREQERLLLVQEHRRTIEKAQRESLHATQREQANNGRPAKATTVNEKTLELARLKGIGTTGGMGLCQELLYRRFHNGKQVGSSAGLVSSPFLSGGIDRDQGISKAGNKRARWLMVEMAWGWLRYQPNSALAQWFNRRFGEGKRHRRIGIVALARKLLVALWRFLEFGVVPEGAVLKKSVRVA